MANKRGRISKYETNVKPNLAKIAKWAEEGAVEKDICKRLKVAVSSFATYKLEHPELLEALKKAKDVADDAVEAALHKRAVGYMTDEVKVTSYKTPDGKDRTFRTVTRREVIPDVRAQIFWLKNRRPEKWRDRSELGIDNVKPIEMTAEENKL